MHGSAPARVVVTGIGTVNPLATSAAAFAEALRAGTSALAPLTLFDTTGFRSRIGGQVAPVPLPAALPGPLRRRLSRADGFALAAVAEALADGGVDPTARPTRIGIALGGTTGGMLRTEQCVRDKTLGAVRRYRHGALVGAPISTSADVVATTFGIGGPRLTVSTACSSSATALGIALDWLRLGRCDVVVAGGTESLCATVFAGFNALHAISPTPCRPFDRARNGLSLGEGAAVLILERAADAAARGARVHAALLDYGTSADAHHLTAPHPDGTGAILAMRRALARAGVAPAAVDYVNAHGTGTPLNDAAEIKAVRAVFGAAAGTLAISSTKAALGHTLGAAGAIEALATIIAVRDGFLPPTVGLEEPEDPDLDFVPRQSRPAALRLALSNSYGFGGNNTSLVIGRA
jgi:3-oxoacyl-[acyl-carrier-protein] synthase II